MTSVIGKQGEPKTIQEALENVNKHNLQQARDDSTAKRDELFRQYQKGEISKNEFYSRYEMLNGGYDINCQRCVWAYELQRRGYDVEALPNLDGDTQNALSRNGNWMKLGVDIGEPERLLSWVDTQTNASAAKNAVGIMASWGEGSRGIIRLGRRSGAGHVFNVEYSNGKIKAVDAQTGEIYTSLSKALTSNKAVPYLTQIVRTDNVTIDMTQVGRYVKKRGA